MSKENITLEFDKQKILNKMIPALIDGVIRINVELVNQIQKKLNSKGTGTKHRSLKYTSSREGQPPANQTGTLMRSFRMSSRPRFESRRLAVTSMVFPTSDGADSVVSPLVYGAILEAKKSENGLNRPYLRGDKGAIAKTRLKAQSLIDLSLNEATKAANTTVGGS